MGNNGSNTHIHNNNNNNNTSTASMLRTMSDLADIQEPCSIGLSHLQTHSWDHFSRIIITTLTTTSHINTMNNNRSISHYSTDHTIIHTNIMLLLTPSSNITHRQDTSTSCRQPPNIPSTTNNLFHPPLRPSYADNADINHSVLSP